jgi:alkylation response protein AidB-like acyl-CoA dehydrogenase
VGLEGVAVSEAAYQHAVAYARGRVQGKPIGGAECDPIIHHPDVRRMLMDMRARTEAMRALAYCTAACMDRARHHPDPGVRAHIRAGSARVRTAERSEPACGPVRFMVPVHSPATIFGRKRCLSSSDA